jgi:hypothetical protein
MATIRAPSLGLRRRLDQVGTDGFFIWSQTCCHHPILEHYINEPSPKVLRQSSPNARLPALGLPELLVLGRTQRLTCKRAGKTRIFMPTWDSSGESRLDIRPPLVPNVQAMTSSRTRSVSAPCYRKVKSGSTNIPTLQPLARPARRDR